MAKRLLILGGTGEARALAEALAPRFKVTTSLAGRTAVPKSLPGTVRSGGFGGEAGFTAYLQAEKFDAVIDATHPFARVMPHTAKTICDALDLPRLRLLRPGWQPQPGDDRTYVSDLAEAALLLPLLCQRALITSGREGLTALANLPTVHLVIRLMAPLADPPPFQSAEILIAAPPFEAVAERALMIDRQIGALVTKDSGGKAMAGKITAARDLRLPVILLKRPPAPDGPQAETVDATVQWVETHI
ncbi:MAG: cobalt-precorrin-6A reductase [Magnetospiraceae bacterium]